MTDFDFLARLRKQDSAMEAVFNAERNPTEFVNFVVTGNTEGLSDKEKEYLEAVQNAYTDAVNEAFDKVKAEQEGALGAEEEAE